MPILEGCMGALVLGLNTLGMSLALLPAALVKLAIPAAGVRRRCDALLNALAQRWVAQNFLWFRPGASLRIEGAEQLRRRGWYVVTCNHQCWADIFVLQRALYRRTPLLKFFLKRELLYVPVIGLAWWALGFPFMRRRAGSDDLATARAACERFRAVPTALLNFVEGTRYTPAKARHQRSPYRHLLKPKGGGMAVALAMLGDKVDAVLDVTIVYPQGAPSFWQLLCNRVGEVQVRIERVAPPRLPAASAAGAVDREFRSEVQEWITRLWGEKDLRISRAMASA